MMLRFHRIVDFRSLRTNQPVLHVDFTHGKVVDVGRRERRTDAGRRGGNQAVSLMQCDIPHGMRATPGAGPHSLGCSQRRKTQSVEKPSCRHLFAGTTPTPDLLDRDRACPWLRTHAAQSGDPEHSRPASKYQLYLPSKQELVAQFADGRREIEQRDCSQANLDG